MKRGKPFQQYCKYGHDTSLTGRNKDRSCKVCKVKHLTLHNTNYQSKHRKAYISNRLAKDPIFKMSRILRTRLAGALDAKEWLRTTHFSEYIGCTREELKLHLERQFQPGMNWNNHTRKGWHVDHIVPLYSATTVEELYRLCHYSNLQPLWAKNNLSKGNK